MTYAMTFDNSWEIMTEDEMYDVNRGWSSYIGADSLQKITNMLGTLSGQLISAGALALTMKVGVLAGKTGIGLVVAVLSAIGVAGNLLAFRRNGSALGTAMIGYVFLNSFLARASVWFGLTFYRVRHRRL